MNNKKQIKKNQSNDKKNIIILSGLFMEKPSQKVILEKEVVSLPCRILNVTELK